MLNVLLIKLVSASKESLLRDPREMASVRSGSGRAGSLMSSKVSARGRNLVISAWRVCSSSGERVERACVIVERSGEGAGFELGVILVVVAARCTGVSTGGG